MVRTCCVPNCNSGITVPSNAIPSNPEDAKKWIEAINRLDLLDLHPNELNKYRVCGLHFEDNVYLFGKYRKIKPGCYPTLGLSVSNTKEETTDAQRNDLSPTKIDEDIALITENSLVTMDKDVSLDNRLNKSDNVELSTLDNNVGVLRNIKQPRLISSIKKKSRYDSRERRLGNLIFKLRRRMRYRRQVIKNLKEKLKMSFNER